MKITGLNYEEKYETYESLKKLRYGRIMIVADQNPDGALFTGLIINFIHKSWPNLLGHHFLSVFITPIIKVYIDIMHSRTWVIYPH